MSIGAVVEQTVFLMKSFDVNMYVSNIRMIDPVKGG